MTPLLKFETSLNHWARSLLGYPYFWGSITRVTSDQNSNTNSNTHISFSYFTFPGHPTGFSFCFFSDFLANFILLSSQQQQTIRSRLISIRSYWIFACKASVTTHTVRWSENNFFFRKFFCNLSENLVVYE